MATASWPCTVLSPVRQRASSHPKVLGTAGQPSAVSSRPTSTSGLSPSPSTRKNFTITASASARPAGGVRITEEFDCSLEITRTCAGVSTA